MTPAERVLVVDGDCPMCMGFAGVLIRLRLIAPEARRPLQTLEPELAERAVEAGVRNEIVALDPSTGALHPGLAGILWALEPSALGPLARLASRPALLRPLGALYRFVAYNRRFLTTPKPPEPGEIRCACEPDPRPALQGALIAVAAAFALAVSLGLGLAAPPGLRVVGARLGVLGPTVKLFWPWALPVLLGATLDASVRLPYLTHLAATAAAGAAVLAPLALAGILAPDAVADPFESLLQVSLICAALLMFAMQRKRVAFLRLRGIWLATWVACAGFGVAALGWLHTLG